MTSLEPVVRDLFTAAGVAPRRIEMREYPGESNVVVFVAIQNYHAALKMAPIIEAELGKTADVELYVVVRKDTSEEIAAGPVDIRDAKVDALQRLISARNRVSEVQPSLSYVPDMAGNLATVTAQRHQLIFGRRGVGKSTLLVEARKRLEEDDSLTVWVNLQTLRKQEPERIALLIARTILRKLSIEVDRVAPTSHASVLLQATLAEVERLLRKDHVTIRESDRLTPDVHETLKAAMSLLGSDLFVFIDDFYYVPRSSQPEVLDALHAFVRDVRAWLKVATIRNLSRWFDPASAVGLQTGQDADIIDLDITLEQPQRLRVYLEQILTKYCLEVGINSVRRVFRTQAIDRLVLASGGVPRDFLVLASAAIRRARENPAAKVAGVQNVNRAAGDASEVKIQELEEDVAANAGLQATTLRAKSIISRFCLDEQATTFFLVDFAEKERLIREYQLLVSLVDLRLLHLIHSSLSDAHQAGRRYEVFLLDLSQYSGARLKQKLRVLDLEGDELVVRRTTTREKPRRASSPSAVTALLRTAPLFSLSSLSNSLDSV